MRKNFLDFIEKKKIRSQILESFNIKNFNRVNALIISILKKHTKLKIAQMPGYIDTFINNQHLLTSIFIIDMGRILMHINWFGADYKTAYSIDFFYGANHLFTGRGNSILTLYMNNSSIVYFLPIIWTLINSDNFNINQEEAEEIGRSVFKNSNDDAIINYEQKQKPKNDLATPQKESLYHVGAITYKIINEEVLGTNDLDAYVKDLEEKRNKAKLNANNSPQENELYNQLENDYKNVIDAINGGATTIEELNIAIQRNVPVTISTNNIDKFEKELDNAKNDPEETFKKMNHYIDMIIKGINPSLIICGAPGVGETYRVNEKLRDNGYIEGENLNIIKGKCTARKLYTELYKFKEKGNITVIDDADSLVGKNADENSINILKGALDSTSSPEGKLITYGISGKLQDDEGKDIPKKFYYNGSVIIITNWNAGNLDSALKGRSFIQDIHFTVEDSLKIIKNIMPKIDPENLSLEAKFLAYNYLEELAKNNVNNMEISVRTFGICAKIFETSLTPYDDFTNDDAKAMIEEQMALWSARRGQKY